jgi:acyl-CoA thioesterase-1
MDLSLNLNNLKRRHCIVLATTLAATGICAATASAVASAAASAERTILIVGDSLSAEYGLRRGSGWVALLEKKLIAEKKSVTVVNASISGETSSGGRARLDALLKQQRPGLVVIELGANDALRGLPLAMTRDNLNAMAQAASHAGAKVLLLGIQVPPNYGRVYNQRFASMFTDVAKGNKAALVPFFLKGVADVPDSERWFQADRIHPNEQAHPKILANIWPLLIKMLPK